MSGKRLLRFLLVATILAGWGAADIVGQEPAPQEMSSTSSPFTLQVQRNEVPVRVIVRDAQGNPVRNLTKNDFLILDNGKPQVITGFSTEGGAPPAAAPASGAAKPAGIVKPSAPQIANRFVAFYFDDLVAGFVSIARSRMAVLKYLQTSLKPTDRVGIFTSSGQGNVDFTSDRDKLQAALERLRPNGFFNKAGKNCPNISDYQAYLIVELHDPEALRLATQDEIGCMGLGGNAALQQGASNIAEVAARRVWSQAESQARYSLRGLRALVQRLSVLPGQRVIVFVSPGFLDQSQLQMVSQIIDRAVRARVVVNSLDPRGLWTPIDLTQQGVPDPGQLALNSSTIMEEQAVLAEVAGGTGGIFFHNNNDLDAGFREAGGLEQFSYVLVFSPSPLKLNGKYHHLKVKLTAQAHAHGLTLQARRGYFAPNSKPGSVQAQKEQFYNTLYSRDELNPTLVRIGTSFFKTGPAEAQVTIVARLNPQVLKLRTENGRHVGEVTFVTVLFDNNGNFVLGLQKQLILHLRDVTLARLRSTGIGVSDKFKVPPGTYLVREIVKDQRGLLSSANDTLEIPY